jgi:DNA modification methylase
MQKVIHHKNGNTATVILADAKHAQALNDIDLILTSPPYADARKKHYTSIKPNDYQEWFVQFSQPFAVCLAPDGSVVINIKDKVVDGRRHRYVWQTMLELERLGWLPIDDYVWHKSNAYPGYWPNRFRDAWEYCFHLARHNRPYFNHDAAKVPVKKVLHEREQGREIASTKTGMTKNRATMNNRKLALPDNVICSAVGARAVNKHPAVYPLDLPRFFIPFLSPPGGVVLDPFAGSGTTGIAALELGRNAVLIEKEEKYFSLINERIAAWKG